jgi:hypothetical protein
VVGVSRLRLINCLGIQLPCEAAHEKSIQMYMYMVQCHVYIAIQGALTIR